MHFSQTVSSQLNIVVPTRNILLIVHLPIYFHICNMLYDRDKRQMPWINHEITIYVMNLKTTNLYFYHSKSYYIFANWFKLSINSLIGFYRTAENFYFRRCISNIWATFRARKKLSSFEHAWYLYEWKCKWQTWRAALITLWYLRFSVGLSFLVSLYHISFRLFRSYEKKVGADNFHIHLSMVAFEWQNSTKL